MELKELFYDEHLWPGYYLNVEGVLFSTRGIGLNKHNMTEEKLFYGGPMRKIKGTSCGKYILYRLGKKYSHRNNEGRYKSVGVCSHKALMETFKPLEKNLPEDLVDEWSHLSDVVKSYIKRGMQVDHKDTNTSKPTFHHLSNLRWIVAEDNSRKGQRSYYGT